MVDTKKGGGKLKFRDSFQKFSRKTFLSSKSQNFARKNSNVEINLIHFLEKMETSNFLTFQKI